MPLYEFKCESCEVQFEELVSFERSETGVDCTSCGSQKTHKVLSVFSASVSPGGDDCAPGGCGLPQCGPVGQKSPFT